tara:strand:+ start:523 stop:1116 length:594 start_codon:yes stop_codon:yes gene_type:complete
MGSGNAPTGINGKMRNDANPGTGPAKPPPPASGQTSAASQASRQTSIMPRSKHNSSRGRSKTRESERVSDLLLEKGDPQRHVRRANPNQGQEQQRSRIAEARRVQQQQLQELEHGTKSEGLNKGRERQAVSEKLKGEFTSGGKVMDKDQYMRDKYKGSRQKQMQAPPRRSRPQRAKAGKGTAVPSSSGPMAKPTTSL